jgi:TetR/AcrR family transcriptional regulator, transcriptional repressor of bet genes
MPGTKIAEALRREQIVDAAYELAIRGGLRDVTIRDVARKGDMSTGLVIFHFGTKDRLVLALLDSVLAKTTALSVGPQIADIPNPLERLVALLRQEMERLSTEPKRNRLFFEFWNEGMWNRAVRVRMQRELDRYREAFRPMAEAVIAADPHRFADVAAADLAAVAVSFIKGCAVQSMVEPHLDVAGFLRAAETLLAAPSPVAHRRHAIPA